MGKAKNRNAERISHGQKPKPAKASSGNGQKPFIGNNVFTMEDHDIIVRITSENPDTWTLQQIKNALPYTHTMKNIANYLLRLFPQSVIDAHANLQPPEDETPVETQDIASGVGRTTDHANPTTKQFIARMFPHLGDDYKAWPELVQKNTGIRMTRAQIIRQARSMSLAYEPQAWTETENELLEESYETLINDGLPDTHVYELFEFPRTKEAVVRQIAKLSKQKEALEKQRKELEEPIKEDIEMNENTRKPMNTASATDNDQMTIINQLIGLCMQLSANADVSLHIKLENGMAINIEQNGLKGGN